MKSILHFINTQFVNAVLRQLYWHTILKMPFTAKQCVFGGKLNSIFFCKCISIINKTIVISGVTFLFSIKTQIIALKFCVVLEHHDTV